MYNLNEGAGVFMGRTLLQQRGSIGGLRFVFVKLQGIKNELIFPTNGCIVKNPFKTKGKMYAGDLMEYRMDGTGYLLKTFEVAKAVAVDALEMLIVRNGYRHIPCVGDILMKAPTSLTGTGTAVIVTAVEEAKDATVDVWKVTLGAAIGVLAKGEVLVEGESAGAGKKMLVQNPNTMCPADYDFLYAPATGDDDFDGARYFMTPALHGIAYVSRMSPLPAAVNSARNKSLVTGWFEI